ncbi:hypothetical protein UlMin_034130 [Ulmus minor]
MEGSGETGAATQRSGSAFAFGASQMGLPTMRQLSPTMSPDNSKRLGIPPSHPGYSKVGVPRLGNWQSGSQNLSPGPSHTRSLSQPSFFSLDSLPPLSPSLHREASPSSVSDPVVTEVTMEENVVNSHGQSLPSPVNRGNAFRVGESLPPRRGHRRSNSSDVLMGFSQVIRSSPQLIPISSRGVLDGSVSGRDNSIQVAKQGEDKDRNGNNNGENKKSEADVADDLFNAYMNLDNIEKMNSSEDKDFDSKASGSKTNGCESSDNEVESSINGNPNGTLASNGKREGVKRPAGGDIAPAARHYRSVSMDSYIGDLKLDEECLKFPPLGTQGSLQSPGSLVGGSSKFSMEFGNGDFSTVELKKIMESEKLTEIALSDPKRAKRILANRQSAARSKERRSKYISELEHKVQTLQTEATTLSAQVTKLQRDSAGLTSQNNELKFRLQAMEQQAQLKDALNEALVAEVQRLKIAAVEIKGEAHLSHRMVQQLSLSPQVYQMQRQQQPNQHLYQFQQQHHQQHNDKVAETSSQ